MKRYLSTIALLLVLLGTTMPVLAQEPAVELSQPAVDVARRWLERIDAGDLAGAYTDASPALRDEDDLEHWSAKVAKGRRDVAVKCRQGRDFELRDEGIDAIFLTTFVDGRTIGERVLLTGDGNRTSDIERYRVVAVKSRAPACP